MNGQPTTPPRRTHAAPSSSSHLHQRTASKIHLISPPSNRSSPTYRLMHDSPKHPRSRLAESVASATDFLGGGGNGSKRGKDGKTGRRKLVAFVLVAVVILVMVERNWNGETVMRQGRRIEELTGLRTAQNSQDGSIGRAPVDEDRPLGRVHPEGMEGQKPHRWIKISKPSRMDSTQSPESPPPLPLSTSHDIDFDPSRRFIFVAWMGEQESKAQAHLYQLGLLALATNRTLVLPGVRRSRFGSCYLQNDFSLYYEADTFDRFGIPYITSSDFSSWIEHRDETPTSQMISLVRGGEASLESLDATPKHFCLDRWRLDWTQHDHRAFFLPLTVAKTPEIRVEYGKEVVKALVEEEASVLVMQYNLRYPFLTPQSIASLSPHHFTPPQPYSYFPYSSHWINLGHSIADQISPFVGVHWRTETLDVERIASCGVALVERLRKIRKENPAINTLYLATDYPLDFIRKNNGKRLPRSAAVVANSGTMSKLLTPAHHTAMREFLSLLEGETEDDSFHLTTFIEESRLVPLSPEVEAMVGGAGGGVQDLDPAISGLVDKIILSNAELFYAGLPISDDKQKGCAKLSQFTTQIITGRKESLAKSAFEDEETRLWNDVGHFSLG
ncbi:uncharacterized protein JCM6883_000234 [Sporobolomyces salmoneus]|uniref:uncharacterized protein n=1 Tax=Sporobolomyces salmoneus TaxID=183962 RepID=UPI00316EA7FB